MMPGSASHFNFLVGEARSLTLDVAARRKGQAVAARKSGCPYQKTKE